MKPINIYFYSPSPSQDQDEVSVGTDFSSLLFINTAPVFLDSYILRSDPEFHQRLSWSKIALNERTQEELVREIEEYNIDVVCFSLYFWNNENILEISKGLKRKLKREVLILAGGPSVNVVRDKNYNKNNTDFDYTIYAQGERPFYDILKHKFDGANINVLSTKNCSWLDNDTVKKADYEFYRLTSGSPYIESKHILEKISNDTEYKDRTLSLPYETAKGCPYNCSFCDWTSGLSHKVAKRKFAYELDLDLFHSLGIHNLYMSDANFGMHAEDFGLVDSLASHNQMHDDKFRFISANFSKTKKKQVYEIIKVMLRNKLLQSVKISVQDIDQDILHNIERPDIPWAEQLGYINDLRTEFPNVPVVIELIQGLPGQTRTTWENMLIQIAAAKLNILVFKFIIISNSPASYDIEWRERMGIKTDIVRLEYGKKNEAVVGTYSYDLSDYAYFTMLCEMFNGTNNLVSILGYNPISEVIDALKRNRYYDRVMEYITRNATDVQLVIEASRIFFQTVLRDVCKSLPREKTNELIRYLVAHKTTVDFDALLDT